MHTRKIIVCFPLGESLSSDLSSCCFVCSTVQPKITFLENQTASELEEQITLTCEATGDPTPNIIWSFGRRVFTENEQVLRLRDQGSVGKRLGKGLRLEYISWNDITVEI